MAHGSVAILGAGAIGGYVGAMLHRAGVPVVLVDHWSEHVEAVRRHGLRIESSEGNLIEHPPIFHISQMQAVCAHAPELSIMSVKLYDTEWAAALLATYLEARVPIITVQNALVEETVARIVGWQRTLGGIATGMNVELTEPGVVRRMSARFSGAPVFKIGELSGRDTPRVRHAVELLSTVDTSVVTTDLWNDRWLKLTINSMVSPLGALSALSLDQVLVRPDAQQIVTRLAAECFAVGEALGFVPHPVFGLEGSGWRKAAEGDPDACSAVDQACRREAGRVAKGYVSGTGQDLRKGRKSEVDFFNGYIAARGRECGVDALTHSAVMRTVKAIEVGRSVPEIGLLAQLGGLSTTVQGVQGQ